MRACRKVRGLLRRRRMVGLVRLLRVLGDVRHRKAGTESLTRCIFGIIDKTSFSIHFLTNRVSIEFLIDPDEDARLHEPAAVGWGRGVRGSAEEHEVVQRRRRRRRGERPAAAVSGGRRLDGVVRIHAMFGELRFRQQEQVRKKPIYSAHRI